jgi:hypothetical protein
MKRLRKYYNQTHLPIILLTILVPLSLALTLILSINLTFWNDNSRDLLSAWNALSKLTLLGPPSGIPGIFYGPYWIWLLSFGLLFSKNPLYVTIITATIPYFVLFPILWFRFNKFFNFTSLISCWLLFIFSSGMTYSTQLWNLYPGPLITLTLIYLLIIANFEQITKKQLIISIVTGFLIGLLLNFDLSFGIAFLAGSIIFFIIETVSSIIKVKTKIKRAVIKNMLANITMLAVGFCIAFLPTVLFEARHGFKQTKILLYTFTTYGAVVQLQGLSKMQIIQSFFQSFGNLLQVSTLVAVLILAILIGAIIVQKYKHTLKINYYDKRIITILVSLFVGTLFIYLTAKNPIWAYHFIGVDILFLVLLGFLATKLPLARKGLLLYTIIIVCINIATFIILFHKTDSHYEQQLQVVKIVRNDSKNIDYTVYAYNSSIYTYDFSYLFKWLANKNVPFDPGKIAQSGNSLYLIIPMPTNASIEDFIHNRSQHGLYKEVKMWKTQNAFEVLKFEKVEK